jgi:hypothetical protein
MRLIPELSAAALAAVLLPGGCFAAQPALGCKLSIYALGLDQSSLGKRIVGPDQVVSASYGKSSIIDGGTALRVHLSASGALANRTFTAKNIGRRIAILCDSQVLTRPVIVSQSGATFVVEGVKRP